MRPIHGIAVLFAVLSVAVILVPDSAESADKEINEEAVAKAINAFAVDLFPRLGKGGGNLFFAPYSISTALAMTFSGARGNTAAQMAKVLRLPPERTRLGESFGDLTRALGQAKTKGGGRLDVANALWGQKGFGFLAEYAEDISRNYGGKLNELEFSREPDAARNTINQWVEQATDKKIVELLPPGVINESARLVLTNAIYFKGMWARRFDPEQTQQGPFRAPDGSQIEVPMMRQKGTFGYFGGEGFQAVELPYEGGELSMVVLLPTEIGGLPQFERSVTPSKIEEWVKKLRPLDIWVYLPRFTIATPSAKLREVLSAMGMTEAFTDKADFSGMDGKRDLFLQEVFHKAFVEVKEEGTEAAAATGAVMTLKSSPAPVPEFRADHPFMFLIRHNPTQCIIFMGRVSTP